MVCGLEEDLCKSLSLVDYLITNLTDPPTVTLDEEEVRVKIGSDLRLGCSIEAFPSPVISWATGDNRAITKGKY